MAPLLEIDGLTVTFPTRGMRAPVVEDLSLSVEPGECLGIVGESGSGKSMASRAVLGLVPEPGRIERGAVRLEGRDLVAMPERELRKVRGAEISMIFQDPSSSLNPLFSIGRQLGDVLRTHTSASRAQACQRSVEVLERVGIPDARRRLRAYPFELSGGLRQRVSIALALACEPKLVIADEPTTNLDVSIQAQILDLLMELKRDVGFAILFISHDLGVVAHVADRVNVLYAGRTMEIGPTPAVLAGPRHPYTERLLRSAPSLDSRRGERLPSIPGTAPRLGDVPAGCRFTARCDVAIAGRCAEQMPVWTTVGPGQKGLCHRLTDAAAAGVVLDKEGSHG